MKYFFNISLTAIVALVSAVITFLIGRHIGAAVFSGIYTGIVLACSYALGGMVNEDQERFNGKRLAIMAIAGLLGGLLGGLMMGWS